MKKATTPAVVHEVLSELQEPTRRTNQLVREVAGRLLGSSIVADIAAAQGVESRVIDADNPVQPTETRVQGSHVLLQHKLVVDSIVQYSQGMPDRAARTARGVVMKIRSRHIAQGLGSGALIGDEAHLTSVYAHSSRFLGASPILSSYVPFGEPFSPGDGSDLDVLAELMSGEPKTVHHPPVDVARAVTKSHVASLRALDVSAIREVGLMINGVAACYYLPPLPLPEDDMAGLIEEWRGIGGPVVDVAMMTK